MTAHTYRASLTWAGAANGAVRDYKGYSRAITVSIDGKADFQCSADPAFLGDPAIHNPEDMMLIALSACHMLSYLALASKKRLVVTAYSDAATGTLTYDKGAGQFSEVMLNPVVTVAAGSDRTLAQALHEEAHKLCFIARSVNFPVRHAAKIVEA